MLDESTQYVPKRSDGVDYETRNHHGKWLRFHGSTYLQHEGVFARVYRLIDSGIPVIQCALLPIDSWQLSWDEEGLED